MKNSARNRIIIWSIVSVVLVTVLVWSIFAVSLYSDSINFQIFNSEWSLSNFDDFKTGNADFNANEVSSVEVNWVSGEIEVLYGDTDKITIEDSATDSDNKMYWNLDNNGTLEIYANKNDFSFINIGFFDDDITKNLTITIPKDKKFSEFDINSASADIYADGINATEIEVDSASGGVEIKKLECNDANINNASGDINIFCNNVGKIDIETVSGKTTVSGNYDDLYVSSVSGEITATVENENANIEAESVSGEIELGVDESINGFIVDYEKVSGNFNCEFSGTDRDGRFVYGNGSAMFSIDTVSGNIEIVKK